MNIKEAKTEIKNTLLAYTRTDAAGKPLTREWVAWTETVTLDVTMATGAINVPNAEDIPLTVANEHAVPTETTLYLGSSQVGTPEDVCAVLNKYYS
jgi:hypothetical protein